MAALLTVLTFLGCTPEQEIESGQPHPIIIIDIDTLRADHLGSYGYHRPTSPHLDAFAAESVLFQWAFSQAPNTPPSQTSILTGLYPSTHGMVRDEDRVPEQAVTLAEALANSGYMTAGFHDGGYMSKTFNIDQGFELYSDSKNKGLAAIGPKVESWLRQHHQNNFLLLIHTYDVHTPYAPPPPFDTMFLDGVPAPTPGFQPTSKQMEEIRLSKYTDTLRQLADNDLAYAMALYDGGIAYVDNWFGEFMQLVGELGLDHRAIIVVISDHGEEFQEHGSVLHEKLYSTVTHVPMMIRLPGARHAGPVGEVVETIALMPTLLEMTGIEIPEAVQGRSLIPLIQGRRPSSLPIAIGESPFFGERRYVASGDLKWLYTRRGEKSELYRYREDRAEQEDLSGEMESQVSEMRQLLDQWQEMVDHTALTPDTTTPEMDPETRDQLRALGYIQ